MNKIASPVELQHELQRLIRACQRPGVSRLHVANELATLADRVAALPYTIEKLKLDRDGYVNGKYYGTGDPLFYVETKDRESDATFRARDLQHAKKIVEQEYDSHGNFKRLHREGPKKA